MLEAEVVFRRVSGAYMCKNKTGNEEVRRRLLIYVLRNKAIVRRELQLTHLCFSVSQDLHDCLKSMK